MTPPPPVDAPPVPDVLSRDLTAERAVLGAMILAPDRIVDIAGTGLEADDFHRPAHGTLYDVLTGMYAADQPIDPITVKGYFDAHGWPPGLAPIHLIQVIEAVPTPGHGIHYARIVTGHAHRRRLADAVTRAAHDLQNPAVHLTDVTDRLDTDLTAAQTAESAEPPGWPPPIPLATRPTLPPFPVAVLPDWLADMVAAVAEFTQTPPDLAGTIALAALSTAAGGRAVVEVRGSWREPVNLFTVVVLPPGSRKSAVFAAITGPLLTAERDLIERTKPAIIEAQLARKVATRTAEKAAQIAASVDADRRVNALAEAAGAAMTADAVTIPIEPRLIADDITSEAAATLLAEQGGRLAVLSAEGGIFATLAGRYSGTPNLEVFLKGHAGDMLRVDRKGRAAEHIENPALTLGLAVQPDILRDLADMPGFRGRGLLARILFAVPVNTVGYRRINTDPVPAHVHTRYTDHLTALITTMADWSTDPAVLQLTPDANQAVIAIEQTIEPRLAPGGTWGHIVDWGSKYTGAVVRLAGLLHLAEHRTDGWRRPITADTLTAAAALGEYYAAHATAAFDDMGTDPTLDKARTVLHRLTTHPTSRISRRDLFTALPRSRFRKITDLDPALDLLDQHGYLRPAPAPPATGAGRPPSPTYLIHPTLTTP